MQLTNEQRKFFIDPIQDGLADVKQLLVTEERYGRGTYLHKVTDVTGICTDNNRIWWKTAARDYVVGAPVNPHFSYDQPVIGILSDDLFVVGLYNGRAHDNTVSLTRTIRSDMRSVPLFAGEGLAMRVPTCVAAAPWAVELMPKPGDPDSVTNAKLALAKQRWEQRYAKGIIIQQALYRDWWDDMETLQEDHDLPSPRLGALFEGNAMVQLSHTLPTDSLTDEQKEMLAARQARAFGASSSSGMFTAVRMTLPVRVQVNKPADLQEIRHDSVLQNVRSALGDYNTSIADYTLSPVLRSAA